MRAFLSDYLCAAINDFILTTIPSKWLARFSIAPGYRLNAFLNLKSPIPRQSHFFVRAKTKLKERWQKACLTK
jgi:hypothetical protein